MNENFRIPPGTVKNYDEIKLIAESCKIVAETLVLLHKYIQPGIETIELDRIAEDYIRTKDATPAFKGFESNRKKFHHSLCISIDDEVIHGIPGKRILEEGQIVSIDCGVLKNRYYGDSAITYPVGQISLEKQKLLEVTEKSLEIAIENAFDNSKIYDISRAIQNFTESNGFSLTRDYCGHGVGKELHEFPPIPNFVPPLLYRKQYPNIRLMKGMTVAIEPMVHAGKKEIYVTDDGWTVKTKDGSPAAHFEHTVLITDDKALILSMRN
jgi:methionyl aminopeptidase